MECLYCGGIIKDGETRCDYCGAPVSSEQYEAYKAEKRRLDELAEKKRADEEAAKFNQSHKDFNAEKSKDLGAFTPLYDGLIRPAVNFANKTKQAFVTPQQPITQDPFQNDPFATISSVKVQKAAPPKKRRHWLISVFSFLVMLSVFFGILFGAILKDFIGVNHDNRIEATNNSWTKTDSNVVSYINSRDDKRLVKLYKGFEDCSERENFSKAHSDLIRLPYFQNFSLYNRHYNSSEYVPVEYDQYIKYYYDDQEKIIMMVMYFDDDQELVFKSILF